MRFIPTRIHGMLDYVVGVILIVAPFVLGFADGGPAQWVPIALGVAALVYSLVTDYELGMVHLLPMPGHLALDALSGVFLAASPWLFGFAERVFWPHLILGLFEILASLTSQTQPGRPRLSVVA